MKWPVSFVAALLLAAPVEAQQLKLFDVAPHPASVGVEVMPPLQLALPRPALALLEGAGSFVVGALWYAGTVGLTMTLIDIRKPFQPLWLGVGALQILGAPLSSLCVYGIDRAAGGQASWPRITLWSLALRTGAFLGMLGLSALADTFFRGEGRLLAPGIFVPMLAGMVVEPLIAAVR